MSLWLRSLGNRFVPARHPKIGSSRRFGRAAVEQLEPRLLLVGDIYVDDDWSNLNFMDDPPGPATSFGMDAFATIQGGINAVDSNGRVHVAAGNYPENILVNKRLSILGQGPASTIVDASAGDNGISVSTGGDSVAIEHLAIEGAQQVGIKALNVTGLSVTNVRTDHSGPTLIGTTPNRAFVGSGIQLNQVTGATLTNITSVDNGGRDLLNPDTGLTSDIGVGIAIYDSMNVSVHTATVTGNGSAGLGLFATGGTQGPIVGNSGIQLDGVIRIDPLIGAGTGILTSETGGENGSVAFGTSFALNRDATDVAWTMVVMPDTQVYQFFPAVFQSMTNWILANKLSRKIELVLQEGDLVQNNNATQWQITKTAMSVLDGQVPYLLSTGNHDYGIAGNGDDRTTLLNSYFHLDDNPLNNSPDGILTTEYIAGRLENSYATLAAPDGRQVLVFSLEFAPRQQVVDWANSVASQPQFDDFTAVLLTHAYLEEGPAVNGEPTALRSNWDLYGTSRLYNPHSYPIANINPLTDPVHDGEELWNELVGQHNNFELVFNGHYLDDTDTNPDGAMATAWQTSVGVGGNSVHEIVFNAQDQPNGGNGYMRLMEFLNDGRTVQARTYSPSLDRWLVNARNQFQLPVTQTIELLGGDATLVSIKNGMAANFDDEDNLATAMGLLAKVVMDGGQDPDRVAYFDNVLLAARALDAAIQTGIADPSAYVVDLTQQNTIVVGPHANLQSIVNDVTPGTTIRLTSGTYSRLVVDGDVTLDGSLGEVIIQDGAAALEVIAGQVVVQNGITLSQSGAFPVIVVAGGNLTLDQASLSGGAIGVQTNDGNVNISDSNIFGSPMAVQVVGGHVNLSSSTLLGVGANSIGVSVESAGSAFVATSAISGFDTGIQADGGVLRLDNTSLNGNTAGLVVENSAVVDAGQSLPGTDYTGLGISLGGNNFSSFNTAATATAGAILNLNVVAGMGPQGFPADVSAQQNLFFSPTPANIELVVWHDVDNSSNGFVDYFPLSDLNLTLDLSTIDEGSSAALTVMFANLAQAHVVTINWGDGQSEDVVNLAVGTFFLVVDHTYIDDENGPVNSTIYSIDVTVREAATSQSISGSTEVTVANIAPVVALTGLPDVDEGGLYTLTVGPVMDPGDDTIVAYEIDWGDGNSDFVNGNDLTLATEHPHTYRDGLAFAARTVTIQVVDDDGSFNVGELTINVHNVAPSAVFQGFGIVNEGGATTVFFTDETDPSLDDQLAGFHYAYDFDNDGIFDIGDGTYFGSAVTPNVVIPPSFVDDGPFQRTIKGRIIDKDEGITDLTVDLMINNVAPVFVAGANVTIDTGVEFSRILSFHDPGSELLVPAGWIVQIDYGDGGGPQPPASFDSLTRVLSLAHTYQTPGMFTVTVTIDDQDGVVAADSFLVQAGLPTLQVSQVEFAPNGFRVRFNRALDTSVLNLYDGLDTPVELPDIDVFGLTAGSVGGSILWDAASNTIVFIATEGKLPADSYTLRLVSAPDGFVDLAGSQLDGDNDGMAGDDFVQLFNVSSSGQRVVGLSRSFVRGPGQAVDLTPADASDDPLVITIDNAEDVVAVDFDIYFDPSLLTLGTVGLAMGMPTDWSITQNPISPGVIRITASGTTAITGLNKAILTLDANVDSLAPYGASHEIRLQALRVNESIIPAAASLAFHKVAYLGDVNADATNMPTGSTGPIQAYGGTDGGLISRVVVALDSGFDAFDWIDPVLIGDVTGDGTLSGLDSSFIRQVAIGIARPEIPDLPAGGFTLVNSSAGLDPTFSIDQLIPAISGTAVSIPLRLDIAVGAVVVGATFDVYFNDLHLELLEIIAGGDWLSGNWSITTNAVSSNHWRVAISSNNSFLGTPGIQNVATLVFQVAVGFVGTISAIDLAATFPGEHGLTWNAASGSVLISTPDGDFNNDSVYDCDDIDSLIEKVSTFDNDAYFDLNQDGVVNVLDIDAWLAEAGGINLGPGRVYLPGDATLNGAVDGDDFILWNQSKFTHSPAWCHGDFNGDGFVDGLDFVLWNAHKFQSSDNSSARVALGLAPAGNYDFSVSLEHGLETIVNVPRGVAPLTTPLLGPIRSMNLRRMTAQGESGIVLSDSVDAVMSLIAYFGRSSLYELADSVLL